MIIESVPPPERVFDAIVVGAGAVGLSLAIRLAERGQNVCVIEAGTDKIATDYRSLNSGSQAGTRHHLGLMEGRYKGLGGTTRLWGGQLMPFAPADFLPDPCNNKPGWPIGYQDLAPWTDDALTMLGVDRSAEELAAQWQAKTGQPLTFGPDLLFAPSVWMKQPDFNRHFRANIASPKGPQILLGKEVTGILLNTENGEVTGVRLRGRDGELSELKALSTVLACGTLEISRLLLRAKATWPATPLGQNRQVGKWFIDHLHGVVGTIKPINRAALGALFDTFYARAHKITPKIRLSDEVMARKNLSSCAVTINAEFGPGEAISELQGLVSRMAGREGVGPRSLGQSAKLAQVLLPLAWRYLTSRRSGKFLSGDASLGIEIEQVPSHESYIALATGVPPDHAGILLNWSVGGGEMRAVTHCARATKMACESRELGTIELDPMIIPGDPAFFDKCSDSSHQAGGARMANSAEQGVVNPDCQVFGMPGLFVAGAATFASGSFANPTLTAIAGGLRLAEHLAGNAR